MRQPGGFSFSLRAELTPTKLKAIIAALPRTRRNHPPDGEPPAVFFTGCPCRKSDPVGNGQRIGRSCVGCASCLGCPLAWSLTCFGHEQRGKLRSWCLDSRLFCCIAPGTMASALRVFGYRRQTQPKTPLSAISKDRLPIVLALEVPTPPSAAASPVPAAVRANGW